MDVFVAEREKETTLGRKACRWLGVRLSGVVRTEVYLFSFAYIQLE